MDQGIPLLVLTIQQNLSCGKCHVHQHISSMEVKGRDIWGFVGQKCVCVHVCVCADGYC